MDLKARHIFPPLLQVDAQRLTKLISKQLFGRVVAVNELVLVHLDGLALVIRLANVNTLDEAAREEALSYHCYRGVVTPDTIIYLTGENFLACSHLPTNRMFPSATSYQLETLKALLICASKVYFEPYQHYHLIQGV